MGRPWPGFDQCSATSTAWARRWRKSICRHPQDTCATRSEAMADQCTVSLWRWAARARGLMLISSMGSTKISKRSQWIFHKTLAVNALLPPGAEQWSAVSAESQPRPRTRPTHTIRGAVPSRPNPGRISADIGLSNCSIGANYGRTGPHSVEIGPSLGSLDQLWPMACQLRPDSDPNPASSG